MLGIDWVDVACVFGVISGILLILVGVHIERRNGN